ncbi:MAG: hypothetical protein NVSMB9_31810 [Isosphaeraceae bacterium]
MPPEGNSSGPEIEGDPQWDARLIYWRRKLGRIRLGVEPVEEQLAKYRRVTLLLSAIPLGIGLIILALFSAFRRPDVGLVVDLFLILPIVALAWIDHAVLRFRVLRYLKELRTHEERSLNSKTGRP